MARLLRVFGRLSLPPPFNKSGRSHPISNFGKPDQPPSYRLLVGYEIGFSRGSFA